MASISFFFGLLAARMAGVYNDSDPPRKTMRRGVLMTLLQQSAMTLPLWIGKPGERYYSLSLLSHPSLIFNSAVVKCNFSVVFVL